MKGLPQVWSTIFVTVLGRFHFLLVERFRFDGGESAELALALSTHAPTRPIDPVKPCLVKVVT
jgi:hypothetical protein